MELASLLVPQNGNCGAIHFFPAPVRMRNLHNAVTDALQELELEEYIQAHIREITPERVYCVTFQETQHANNQFDVLVEYSTTFGTLLDDESWEGDVQLHIVARQGISEMSAQVILEELAIVLDPHYFDDDDETISSQPLTPPPSRVQ